MAQSKICRAIPHKSHGAAEACAKRNLPQTDALLFLGTYTFSIVRAASKPPFFCGPFKPFG
jgi:hypothetical protein